MREDSPGLAAADHDAFYDLASFTGYLDGSVAGVRVGMLELRPPFNTTAGNEKVVYTDYSNVTVATGRAKRGSAPAAHDAKFAPRPVGVVSDVVVGQLFGCGLAWVRCDPRGLNFLGAFLVLDVDLLLGFAFPLIWSHKLLTHCTRLGRLVQVRKFRT